MELEALAGPRAGDPPREVALPTGHVQRAKPIPPPDDPEKGRFDQGSVPEVPLIALLRILPAREPLPTGRGHVRKRFWSPNKRAGGERFRSVRNDSRENHGYRS